MLGEIIREEQPGKENNTDSLMEHNDTRRRPKKVTGPGLIESSATLMLRMPDSRFRRLTHCGVNAEGCLGTTARIAGMRPTPSGPQPS